MNLIDDAYEKIVADWRAQEIAGRAGFASALTDYRVRFAYNSGAIENPAITYHDTREIFENGKLSSFSGDPRTIFEIQNLKECHELMLDALAERRSLDEGLLLEVHRTLTQGTYDERRWEAGERPGSYKRNDYVVGAGDVGAPPDQVADEVRALLDELAASADGDVLTSAAYFHLVFENIHPFADGNGRCGRELMNYLLLQNGHPPIIVFEDDRLAYYGAIEAWDSERAIEPMLTFLKAETIRTWRPG